MASASKIDHHFVGDPRLVGATADHRKNIRNALVALQQEINQLEGHPVKLTAEIKLNVSGPSTKEHVYSVSVVDSNKDVLDFSQSMPVSTDGLAALHSATIDNPDSIGATSSRSQAPRDSGLAAIRPSKRLRTGGEDVAVTSQSVHLREMPSKTSDDVLAMVNDWRNEWKSQGGWMYDTLTKSDRQTTDNARALMALDKKLDGVQDVLGQSMNSASATTLTELGNINKTLPWLEHCRKTNADKVQAREEKWRSSSASFHDQNRREREAAEKRLEEKLDNQRQLLVKLAKLNGIEVDEADDESREASLGAQLTAELNLEASRANSGNGSKDSTLRETIEDGVP